LRHPAIAVLEFGSVAAGLQAADALLKRAPVALFKAGTVHPGRYVVLVGGTVAAIEEAHAQGIRGNPAFLLDDTILPDVHEDVYAALLGFRREPNLEALGIIETRGVASIVRAADAAAKGADVRVAELRMADDLGGNSFVVLDGLVSDVQTAVSIGSSRAGRELLSSVTIPRLDSTLRQAVSSGTVFRTCDLLQPEGAEHAAR
jgi:microcompartment protein CcmL/EutN